MRSHLQFNRYSLLRTRGYVLILHTKHVVEYVYVYAFVQRQNFFKKLTPWIFMDWIVVLWMILEGLVDFERLKNDGSLGSFFFATNSGIELKVY